MDFALPFGNDLIIIETLLSKKPLTKKKGVEIQVNVQLILQHILHEAYSVESAFIVHETKHLDNNNFNKFHGFRELMIEDGICNDFVLKSSH
jgi:hypothetical protein